MSISGFSTRKKKLKKTATVSPLAFPEITIAVQQLFA
jgi:hypothetical protein